MGAQGFQEAGCTLAFEGWEVLESAGVGERGSQGLTLTFGPALFHLSHPGPCSLQVLPLQVPVQLSYQTDSIFSCLP